MADLLAQQLRRIILRPALARKNLAQERVQRLLDAVTGVAAGVLLGFETGEEPFQDQKDAAGGILFFGWGAEDVGVLDPEARKFGGGFVGEDEGGCGDVAEVASDCCYALEKTFRQIPWGAVLLGLWFAYGEELFEAALLRLCICHVARLR